MIDIVEARVVTGGYPYVTPFCLLSLRYVHSTITSDSDRSAEGTARL